MKLQDFLGTGEKWGFEAIASVEVTALPAIMQYSFSPCPSPSKAFSYEDVPHSCRKCCSINSKRVQFSRFGTVMPRIKNGKFWRRSWGRYSGKLAVSLVE
ncbi:MAG: hypothetical protein HWQ41_17885 [Nostoc sp. NOS(2021)]|uniref:hypothetical protein n=1 Tax=Nostoc sp. NOS(2021) TaxID=2815407 RepID=UPI0025EC8F4C|nr:hypothetical protein [Nostoc sp. NOS(2021)]MBN3897072.1 hypothetical protein [Nostoc sp. NOS(2021)]